MNPPHNRYEWEITIDPEDTDEEIENKLNHVIADAVYQEYIK